MGIYDPETGQRQRVDRTQVLELMEAVRREKLSITSVFAMHMRVRPWADLEAAVAKVRSATQ